MIEDFPPIDPSTAFDGQLPGIYLPLGDQPGADDSFPNAVKQKEHRGLIDKLVCGKLCSGRSVPWKVSEIGFPITRSSCKVDLILNSPSNWFNSSRHPLGSEMSWIFLAAANNSGFPKVDMVHCLRFVKLWVLKGCKSDDTFRKGAESPSFSM